MENLLPTIGFVLEEGGRSVVLGAADGEGVISQWLVVGATLFDFPRTVVVGAADVADVTDATVVAFLAAAGGFASWLKGGIEGMETMERIRALQTPLQQMTVGSGKRLSTQTW